MFGALLRSAQLARRIWLSRRGRLAEPWKLTYAVTAHCNSRCTYCGIWRQPAARELDLDEIGRLAAGAPGLGWIDFTGGEPTLRDDFADIVAQFVRRCPRLLFVHFPTNGLQTDRIVAVSERLAAMRPVRVVVTVSLDGPPAIHDRLRGVPGGFARAVETYRRLKRVKGMAVHAGMTLYAENLNAIDATVEAVRLAAPPFTHRDLHVNLPHVSPHYYRNEQGPPALPPDAAARVAAFVAMRGHSRTPFEWMERAYQRRIGAYLATQRCPLDCAALMSSCFVAADGTVYPCSIWNAPLGHLRDADYRLDVLLRSQKAIELRRDLLAKRCPNCWTPCEAYPTLAASLPGI